MTVTYTDILHDVLIQARDILRADATLCGTSVLNIPGGTTAAYNYIFAGRPNNQRKAFENPRIICEESINTPQNYGDNPDGYHNDKLTFQITIFKDNVAFDKRYKDVERIKTLLDNTQFNISSSGHGTFKVRTYGGSLDPDKSETLRNYLIVDVEIITGG